MKSDQQLVDKGYKQAAFKYKANAEKFVAAWKKKGYNHVGWLRSSGPVVDSTDHVQNAYYCVAEKEEPKYTAKELRWIAEYDKMDQLRKSDPVEYFRVQLKRSLKQRGGIDPEIRQVVIELNNNNQFTISSCAGHGNERGHLFISRKMYNGNVILDILRKHGLKGITRDKKDYVDNDGDRFAVYEFDPIGKPKPKRTMATGTRKTTKR